MILGDEFPVWDPELLQKLPAVTGIESDLALARHMQKVQMAVIQRAPLQYLSEIAHGWTNFWTPWVPLESAGSRTFPARLAKQGRSQPKESRILQLIWALLHMALIAAFAFQAIVFIGTGLDFLARRWFAGRTKELRTADPVYVTIYALVTVLILYTGVISSMADIGDPRHRWPVDSLILFVTLLGYSEWRRRLHAPSV